MEPLKNALRESTAKMGLKQLFEAGLLVPEWERIVGEQIAARTRPVLLRGGNLIVDTVNSVWSHQLTAIKPQLLARLREAGAPVKDICFRVAPIPARPEEDAAPRIAAPAEYRGIPKGVGRQLKKAMASYMGAMKAIKPKRPK